jgi:hypothetical protein
MKFLDDFVWDGAFSKTTPSGKGRLKLVRAHKCHIYRETDAYSKILASAII